MQPLPPDFLKKKVREYRLSEDQVAVVVALLSSHKTRKAVAGDLQITESTLSSRLNLVFKKFSIGGSERGKLEQLSDLLWMQYQTENPSAAFTPEAAGDINALVKEVRQKVYDYIQERCGTMKVLDMSCPIGLESIYTHVNILKELTGKQRQDISELLQDFEPESFDRLGWKPSKKRVLGLQAVQRHKKLMIFGKPGAGKTTFLKYLAIQCIEGTCLADCVPFFIPLREFAETSKQPNFPEFILQELANVSDVDVADILQQGRVLLLLDGLDEVRAEASDRVKQEIETFARTYSNNQLVVTCRIAAKEYIFEKFTDVEIADFDDKQIKQFATKWFASRDSTKVNKFITKLQKNKRIQDLATRPLLLTLLCLVFEKKGEFKANQAELYGEAIELLLKKWDNSRGIKREQVYKNLSTNHKKELLSEIAFTFFVEGEYLFKKRSLGIPISDYIRTLSEGKAGVDIEVSEIIKSIEAQHGLLVERAKDIYSFPHLTLHEYFTANYIVINSRNPHTMEQTLQELFVHLTDRRWREVFLLAVGISGSVDSLLKAMKDEVDKILAGDKKLQQFLAWIQKKSEYIKADYKPSAIRAFYLGLELYLGHHLTHTRDLSRIRDLARELDNSFENIHDLDNILARDLTRALDLALTLTHDLDLTRARARTLALAHDLLIHTGKTDKELGQSVITLLDELPDQNSDFKAQKKWWNSNGKTWIEKLRQAIIEHQNIGDDRQFNDKQKKKLRQYYDANKFLVECLNSDCYISRLVRKEIEDTLLLPIAEIEKRRTQ